MLRASVQTDIRTGRPLEVSSEDVRKARAQERFKRSILAASDMAVALHENNAPLKVFIEQYSARLEELAKNDPVCQAQVAYISGIRDILEKLPLIREREAMKVLGPQLASLVENET